MLTQASPSSPSSMHFMGDDAVLRYKMHFVGPTGTAVIDALRSSITWHANLADIAVVVSGAQK